MGVMLGRFSETEKKGKSLRKYTLRSSIVECENFEKVTTSVNPVTFITPTNEEKNVKSICEAKLNKVFRRSSSSAQNDSDSVKTYSSNWNFEDEYKSYLQKSMKRKLRSSEVFQPKKLCKIWQEQLASIPQEISTDILQSRPTNLERSSNGNFNTVLKNDNLKVMLEKIPVVDSYMSINENKSPNIENTKSRRRTNIRSTLMKNKRGKNLSLELMEPQLTRDLRIVLDLSIVNKYLNAKRIIDEILRPAK